MRIRICLADEAPRIGSGHRIVEVVSRGPKWVNVRYVPKVIRRPGQRLDGSTREPINVTNQKFRVADWARFEKKGLVI